MQKLPACTAVWAWRQSHVKSPAAHEDHECICFAFAYACVVGKNLKTPKLSPMTDDAITRGGIWSLVSLVYICAFNPLYISLGSTLLYNMPPLFFCTISLHMWSSRHSPINISQSTAFWGRNQLWHGLPLTSYTETTDRELFSSHMTPLYYKGDPSTPTELGLRLKCLAVLLIEVLNSDFKYNLYFFPPYSLKLEMIWKWLRSLCTCADSSLLNTCIHTILNHVYGRLCAQHPIKYLLTSLWSWDHTDFWAKKDTFSYI